MLAEEEVLCRLCAETKPPNDLYHMKDEYWAKQDLYMKIYLFFHIKILAIDQLPKAICTNCCDKVNITWKFNQQIQLAQETLRSLTLTKIEVKSEDNNNSVDDYDSDVPLIEIMKIKQERTKKSSSEEFVECILDENKQNILKKVEISDVENTTHVINNNNNNNNSKRKQKVLISSIDVKKPKVGHPKGQKNSKPTVRKLKDQDIAINLSALSNSSNFHVKNKTKKRSKVIHSEKRNPRKRKPKQKIIKKIKIEDIIDDDNVVNDNDADDDDDDNVSVLSGASTAERNEDGSLMLRNGELEGWHSYPWACVYCDLILNSVVELREHHRTVHNETTKFFCVDCSQICAKYYGFMLHVGIHRRHLKFCCYMCNKFFRNRKILKYHRATHDVDRPYLCTVCGKSFHTQSHLLVHGRCHLPVDVKNKYICDLCPKRFATKYSLRAHKRIHANIRNFTCEQCGKTFVQRGNLVNHILIHENTQAYCCDICGRRFKLLVGLKRHKRIHDGLKQHKCEECGREFRERPNLNRHMRIHTGTMPYTCEFCKKTFRFSSVLTVHKRQHTGERPYSCNHCQHDFANWSNYNKHMKCRHGIDTSVKTRKTDTITESMDPIGTKLEIPQEPNV